MGCANLVQTQQMKPILFFPLLLTLFTACGQSFDALKEQLGLKLTAERGPVEYYVIDSVERPSDN